jgi:hypothetical protein
MGSRLPATRVIDKWTLNVKPLVCNDTYPWISANDDDRRGTECRLDALPDQLGISQLQDSGCAEFTPDSRGLDAAERRTREQAVLLINFGSDDRQMRVGRQSPTLLFCQQ